MVCSAGGVMTVITASQDGITVFVLGITVITNSELGFEEACRGTKRKRPSPLVECNLLIPFKRIVRLTLQTYQNDIEEVLHLFDYFWGELE